MNSLACQSITVASDVIAQSLPTCLNPHFLIGIPNCTTSDKMLFALLVKAGSAGTASVSAKDINVIGEGAPVSSVSVSGNYTINAVSEITPIVAPAPTTLTSPTPNSMIAPIESPIITPTSITSNPISEGNILLSVGKADMISAFLGWQVYLLAALILFVVFLLYFFFYRKKK